MIVNDNFDKLVQNFCQIDLQKLVIEKYHDLLWKKILRDYKKDDFTYLDRYDELKNYVYLQDSIRKYAECNDISCLLDQKLSNYELKEVLDKVSSVMKNKVEVIKEEFGVVDQFEQGSFQVTNFWQSSFFIRVMQSFMNLFNKVFIKQVQKEKNENDLSWLGEAKEEVINNFEGYTKRDIPNLEGSILVNNFEEIEEIEESRKEELKRENIKKICNGKSPLCYHFSNNNFEPEEILIHGLPVYRDELRLVNSIMNVDNSVKKLVKKK